MEALCAMVGMYLRLRGAHYNRSSVLARARFFFPRKGDRKPPLRHRDMTNIFVEVLGSMTEIMISECGRYRLKCQRGGGAENPKSRPITKEALTGL